VGGHRALGAASLVETGTPLAAPEAPRYSLARLWQLQNVLRLGCSSVMTGDWMLVHVGRGRSRLWLTTRQPGLRVSRAADTLGYFAALSEAGA
jgi:hypothetical protein